VLQVLLVWTNIWTELHDHFNSMNMDLYSENVDWKLLSRAGQAIATGRLEWSPPGKWEVKGRTAISRERGRSMQLGMDRLEKN